MRRHTTTSLGLLLACATAVSGQTSKPATSFTGDLGYVNASGNTKLSTLNIADKVVHSGGKWTLTQAAMYVRGETNGTETASQFRISGRADYAVQPRLGVFLGASYERNRFAGFDSRTNEMLGLAWKAVASSKDSLEVDAGGVLTQQSDVSHATQSYPAAQAAGRYEHHFSKTAYFQQVVEYLPNLQAGGAYRLNTQSSVVAPISAHIGVKVSYNIQYDSDPPAGFGTTDRLLTTGVQVSF